MNGGYSGRSMPCCAGPHDEPVASVDHLKLQATVLEDLPELILVPPAEGVGRRLKLAERLEQRVVTEQFSERRHGSEERRADEHALVRAEHPADFRGSVHGVGPAMDCGARVNGLDASHLERESGCVRLDQRGGRGGRRRPVAIVPRLFEHGARVVDGNDPLKFTRIDEYLAKQPTAARKIDKNGWSGSTEHLQRPGCLLFHPGEPGPREPLSPPALIDGGDEWILEELDAVWPRQRPVDREVGDDRVRWVGSRAVVLRVLPPAS
mmetsp:Transcript_9020/g.24293  ORF Transcript_9020/g.24293 Transcript_9020/m.24293 type:complete len:265 (-) Transcript_9020:1204-1998(-)